MKKVGVILAAILLTYSFAIAETIPENVVSNEAVIDMNRVIGFWMNCDNGITSLEIREDGSGALTDLNDDMGVPVQVKAARSEVYDYAICLGGEEYVNDLSFSAEDETLIMYDDNNQTVCFVRDYWYGMPVAYVAPDLGIRYYPGAFELTYDEIGSLLMTCKYREGDRDYIRISLVKDTTMANLLDGLALQSGLDGVSPSYGCWDFTEDEAGSVDYIRNEDGVDYDNFFMAVKCGNDCYLVECHSACLGDPETDPENDLTDLYAETMGSIRRFLTD